MQPNTLVRFDPKTEKFQTWAIPSGGGVVRNMMPTRDGNLALACSAVNRIALVEIKNGGRMSFPRLATNQTGHGTLRSRADPALEKHAEPGARGVVVDGAVGEMRGARARARQLQALVAARGPFVHHGVSDVGMELQRVGARP